MNKDERYITLWRKTSERVLDWDFHTSESLGEAETVVTNLKAQGVIQFSTHSLGSKVDALSSEF